MPRQGRRGLVPRREGSAWERVRTTAKEPVPPAASALALAAQLGWDGVRWVPPPEPRGREWVRGRGGAGVGCG